MVDEIQRPGLSMGLECEAVYAQATQNQDEVEINPVIDSFTAAISTSSLSHSDYKA
jgi:hypothetical protein